MKRDDPRHGTYAGHQAHRKEGKQPCKPCREAYSAYMREYRANVNPNWRDQNRARSRAVWQLVARHRDEFDRLYVDELRRDRVKKLGGAA